MRNFSQNENSTLRIKNFFRKNCPIIDTVIVVLKSHFMKGNHFRATECF